MGLVAGIGAAIGVVTTVAGALETVAAVGAVIGVVGAVTKNPVLSKVGLGLGIVGGVGALASSALGIGTTALFGVQTATEAGTDAAGAAATGVESGAFDAASGAAPDAIGSLSASDAGAALGLPDATSASAAPAIADAAPPAIAEAANPATAAADIPGAVPTGTELAPEDAAALQTSTSNAASDGLINTGLATTSDSNAGAAGAAGVPTDTSVSPPTAYSPAAGTTPGAAGGEAGDATLPVPPQPPGNLGATDPATGQIITSYVDPSSGKIVNMPDAAPGTFGKLVDYVGAHPVIALGALQGAGSLLSGWTSTLTPAQVSALNAQASANQAAANLANQQAANLNMPKAVASSTPVTGTPAPLVPTRPSLLNGAPAPQAVTGKVA
jgi:hypothetical protein